MEGIYYYIIFFLISDLQATAIPGTLFVVFQTLRPSDATNGIQMLHHRLGWTDGGKEGEGEEN